MIVAGAGYVYLMRRLCLSVAGVLDASFRIGEHIHQLPLFSKGWGMVKSLNARWFFLQGKPEIGHMVFLQPLLEVNTLWKS